MKNLLFSSFLILAFNFGNFAQTNETPICPDLSIIGPPGIVKPNESASFTVVVNSKENLTLEYAWAIDSGTILEGQGTQTITVKQPENELIVTVQVKGLPNSCCSTVSARSGWQPIPKATKLDQFSESITQIDKVRIEKITTAIQNDTTAQLYIITGFEKKTSLKSIRQKEQEIRDRIAKAKIDKDKILLVRIFAEVESTQFWLVPAGAYPPEIK